MKEVICVFFSSDRSGLSFSNSCSTVDFNECEQQRINAWVNEKKNKKNKIKKRNNGRIQYQFGIEMVYKNLILFVKLKSF